ncbi:MAG: hypothetical protein HQK84_05135 [Nitrospinae bacterium]|nr:hypothetical protein [Nitrospinota bacterium]
MGIAKFAELADLIGMDPEKTYMGGGFKRENIRIHDIEIEKNTLRALCDVENDYSDTKYFHFTQPSSYSCTAHLAICLFAFIRGIKRHDKGFHIFLIKYQTKWNKVVKTPLNIPIEIRMTKSSLKNRSEEVNFRFSIDNDSMVGSYTAIFRLPPRILKERQKAVKK